MLTGTSTIRRLALTCQDGSVRWRMVAVRCPRELAPLMKKAGGLWEPGSRRWLIERRRIAPLVRALRRATDPLFRQAGMDLDGEGN